MLSPSRTLWPFCVLLLAGLIGPGRAPGAAQGPADKKAEKAVKVPVLVVQGPSKAAGDGDGTDAFHLNAFFEAAETFSPKTVKPADVEKTDLKKYRIVVLLDVPELADAAVKGLQAHVKAGGG